MNRNAAAAGPIGIQMISDCLRLRIIKCIGFSWGEDQGIKGVALRFNFAVLKKYYLMEAQSTSIEIDSSSKFRTHNSRGACIKG